MRIVGHDLSSRMTWWWGFGLLTAAPALALAILGLRAVRAERIERDQQVRDRQAQTARLADSAIRAELAEIERQLRVRDSFEQNITDEDSEIIFFFYDRSGPLSFSRDRVYFGDSYQNSAAVLWTGSVEQLIEQARASEVQHRAGEAIALYRRIMTAEPRLHDWALLSVLRLEQRDDGPLLAEILGGSTRADSLSPSGLPLALISCAYIETHPIDERAKYRDAAYYALAALRSGRWRLSYDERSFYDKEFRGLIADSSLGGDPRLEELANIARLSAAVPVRRDEPTRYFERAETGSTMILLSPSQKSANSWQGAALNEQVLSRLLGEVMSQAGALQTGNAWIADEAGGSIWGSRSEGDARATAEPLAVVPGWVLVFQRADSGGWLDQRMLLWLGFTVMLVATMLVSLVWTMRVVRREADLARLQNDFIAGVSHEFMSPISGVRLLVERMSAGRIGVEGSLGEYHEAVDGELTRLEHHIGRLLEAQQIQAGRRQYNFAPASLSEIAARAIADLKPQAEAKQIRVDLEPGSGLPELQLDREAMTDAIANLIGNAIKYSPACTRIGVSSVLDDNHVYIEVSDEGVGIHRDETKRIFNRFYRGRSSLQQSAKGAGLGLALVKATVGAHGGTVSVTSEPGRGSRFTISLPVDRRI